MTNKFDDKLIQVSFDVPILDFYKGYFNYCFIIFHPFYHNVFNNNYNHFCHYNHKLSYLIKKITWEEILNRTGINDYKRLVLIITYPANDKKFQKLVESEWNEFQKFLKENNIIEPYWEEDKIPGEIILPFLNFLLTEGYNEVKVGDWNNNIETVKLIESYLFEYLIQFEFKNFITTTDYKYCLKLPYHDLPYTFFLAQTLDEKIIAQLNYEGFFANEKTKPYWFLE
ncbi:MAG: DUF2711 family protein [Bacteroidota bacterium]